MYYYDAYDCYCNHHSYYDDYCCININNHSNSSINNNDKCRC